LDFKMAATGLADPKTVFPHIAGSNADIGHILTAIGLAT
jgi:hypothetical protein